MNKADLIEKMASDAGITKTAAATALDSLLDGITADKRLMQMRLESLKFGFIDRGLHSRFQAANHVGLHLPVISGRPCFRRQQ